tara:strand:+ start:245 stop:607 length:363 start_codon:yes stop_codon:yes gene_type:complete
MTITELAARFDRRRHARFVTAFEADLLEGEDCRKVIVGDVSAGGCLLEHRDGFRIGTTVRLRAKDIDMEARIMWSRGDLCGMRFAQSVDPWQVIRANVDGAARIEDMMNQAAHLRPEPTR